jgi:hypothetical protein
MAGINFILVGSGGYVDIGEGCRTTIIAHAREPRQDFLANVFRVLVV